ncbi:putative agmatine deiminase [Pseudocercospora fuligena]|uniref:Putative agmatine deiminase n=1 Tax=Pseudocercospora fuligena TaxID=685502 RepID=A0A8H6RJD6_9PEZI|nr:putative agmatine deiminase [Pseudocercospora fuligena]
MSTLDKLAQSLVTAVTGRTPENASFKALKDYSLRGLKDQSHARTNQFAVKASLEGLTEKLEILGRDDLAEALQSRLEELPTKSRWMPEVLALLLELSDRPAEKTALADVENLNQSASPDAQLTWQEIIADDPLDEADIWDDVEAGYHSSGDELGSGPDDDDTQPTISTIATSVGSEDSGALARLHLTQPDSESIANIQASRDVWRVQSPSQRGTRLSELQLARETLAMLRGYPTDLFIVAAATGRVTLPSRIRMASTSNDATMDVLLRCTRMGSSLNFLRNWTKSAQPAMHVRTMQAATSDLLGALSSSLDEIEQRYITPKIATVISITDVAVVVESAARGLAHLASIIQVFSLSDGRTSQLSLLDSLYDQACSAQMSEDLLLFEVLATVFLNGLKTYLRSTATWIMTGTLSTIAQGIPLVKDAYADCEPAELWHNRYVMNITRDGSPFAPKCVHFAADQIFSLGKARSFLRCLDQTVGDGLETFDLRNSMPSFDAVVPELRSGSLKSFSQCLDTSLQSWLESISTDCTPLLRSKLWNEHGLKQMMLALPYVFFSKDGTAFEAFAETMVECATNDEQQGSWGNQFLLSEVAQTAFSNVVHVNDQCIQVRSFDELAASTKGSVVRKLAAFEVEYTFAWPLQNITRCRTSLTHSRAFAFLLQIYLASSLLGKNFLDLRSVPRSSKFIPLRQRLINFTGILSSYVTTTSHGIHESAQQQLEAALDIDGMVDVWANYSKSLETSLLVSTKLEPIRDAITGMLELTELLAKTTNPDSITVMQDQFERSLKFLIAGIRGVSRAGGESALETLAERLEWSEFEANVLHGQDLRETEPHEGTMMAWPTKRSMTVEHNQYSIDDVDATRKEVAGIIKAIARHEPLHLFVRDREGNRLEDTNLSSAQALVGDVPNVTIHTTPNTYSLWARDTGPMFVKSTSGPLSITWDKEDDAGVGSQQKSVSSQVVGMVLNYNCWGRKDAPNPDMYLAPTAAEALNKAYSLAPFICEGGGLMWDGDGTMLATESAVLNPNRNPGIDKHSMEGYLKQCFGIEKTIWIPGERGRDITDDHIDALARFTEPGTLVVSRPFSQHSEDRRSYDALKAVLAKETDARGRSFKTIDIQEPDPAKVLGKDYAPETGPSVAYVNFHIVNGAVIVSAFGDPESDSNAAKIIGENFAGREIVQVPIHQLAAQGGGIHCSTQQIPA